MQHLELDIPENAHQILKEYSKLSGKPIEAIAIEKILNQLESETQEQKLIKIEKSLKQIAHPLSQIPETKIQNLKTKREDIYKKLGQQDLGRPLSDIINEERGSY